MTNKQGILLIAHGSRRQEANDHLLSIADYLRSEDSSLPVAACFLELAEPDITKGLDELIDKISIGPVIVNTAAKNRSLFTIINDCLIQLRVICTGNNQIHTF